MPNIKPVSDLRKYYGVLKDIDIGRPVFLTKNGRERYAILDMREFVKIQATIMLLSDLVKGEKSASADGWISADEVEKDLGLTLLIAIQDLAESYPQS